MADVNTLANIPPAIPPVVPAIHKRKSGKKKLPVERRRVILSVRVLPSTMEYLNNMGYGGAGRALDILVKSLNHPGVLRMLAAKSAFSIVNLSN